MLTKAFTFQEIKENALINFVLISDLNNSRMKKRDKIIFYVVTGILTLLVGGGVAQYFFTHQIAVEGFTALGFPTWLIYPMGVAKVLGLLTIWAIKSDTLKQWAYAGFTFNFLLAVGAHLAVGDGEFPGALIALVILAGSYFFYSRTKSEA